MESGMAIDEVHIPYLSFIELYRFQIINVLTKVKGINYSEANTRWSKALVKFDEEVYKIMIDLVDKTENGLMILLNRKYIAA